MGPKMVVIKKGEHGSLFVSKENTFVAPAFPLESVYDPTGAGDSFAGGLLGHLCKCKKIDDKKVRSAIIYGSVMASYAVANFSLTGIKKLNKKLIEKRYKEFKNLTSF